MAGIKDIANIWRNIREVDLRPIREEALREVRLVVVGEEGSGRQAFADQLHRDPSRPVNVSETPLPILDLMSADLAAQADLIVLMLKPGGQANERLGALAHQWVSAGKKVVVFKNQPAGWASGTDKNDLAPEAWWGVAQIFSGPGEDPDYLQSVFAPAVMALLPDRCLALARRFPLFRQAVAQDLINETCLSNAAYALGTGLAEIVPVLDIPLNLADMFVLTKAQAFLVYRLGLALGFSTNWQDYVTEFGSVIGGGFLWRQTARFLVGLIPVWGIIPKVAVAYAGTYVVGNVVLRWYLTGRHISTRQIRQLYRQAFAQGKAVAQALLARAPRPRLGKGRSARKALPAAASSNGKTCPNCGRGSSADARFCQYCGQGLEVG